MPKKYDVLLSSVLILVSISVAYADALGDHPVRDLKGDITLANAMAFALVNNPDLMVFSWELRAHEARTLQAGLLPNPELEIDVENFEGQDHLRDFRSAETTIALSQLLELGGKRAKRRRIAGLEQALTNWDYEIKRLEIISQVKKAYIDVLAAQEDVKLKEDLVQISQKTLDAISERFKAGRVSVIEESKAKVTVSHSRTDLKRAQSDLKNARMTLASLWGAKEPLFERLIGDLGNIRQEIPPYSEYMRHMQKSSLFARLDADIEHKEGVLSLEKVQRIPDVTLGGGYRAFHEGGDYAFVANASFTLPLFDRNQGNIKEAQHNLSKAQAEKRAHEIKSVTALKTLYQEISTVLLEIHTIKDSILPEAENVFEQVKEKYNVGKYNYLDLLDAQRTLFEIKNQYVEDLAHYHKSVADIERIVGTRLAVSKAKELP